MDEQSNSEHFFPLELARTNSLHYSVFNLVAFSSIAQLAEKVGVNFWEKETVHQHSLKKSYTALLPYIKKEKTWTGTEITPYYVEEAFSLFLHASENMIVRLVRCRFKILQAKITKTYYSNFLIKT